MSFVQTNAILATLVTLAAVVCEPGPPSATGKGPAPADSADSTLDAARARMVEVQIAGRGIRDRRVLDAMRRVPRHAFVPEDVRPWSYEDAPLPIGEGQTISQPYIVAYMSEQLALDGDERVLEVGTGSGYQAAILGVLAKEVYTIEIVPALARRAAADLARLGFGNVVVREGDGYRGWPDKAPFDAIMVTAAPDEVPEPLLDQLAPGGRMVIPVGRGEQWLVRVTRDARGVHRRDLLPVRFVPMTGEAAGDPPKPTPTPR